MKLKFLLIILFTFSAPAVWAEVDNTDPNIIDDGYIQSQRQAKMGEGSSENAVALDNIRWGKSSPSGYHWDTIVIKPEALEDVYWGQETIRGPVAHYIVTFRFQPGGLTNNRSDAAQSNYLVVSFEAHFKPGQNFSIFQGLFSKYPGIWILSSLEGFVAYDVMKLGRTLELYPFKISMEQKQKMLQWAIQISTEKPDQNYNSYRNNCVTNALRIVSAAQYDEEIKTHLPHVATIKLRRAGLIGDKTLITPQDPTNGGMIDPYSAIRYGPVPTKTNPDSSKPNAFKTILERVGLNSDDRKPAW